MAKSRAQQAAIAISMKKAGKKPKKMKSGGYPKSDKKDFMKRMGYYQAGGLATPPMYGANTIPGSPETAAITYQEADPAKLKQLEQELEEARKSTEYMDEAEANIAKQQSQIQAVEGAVGTTAEALDKSGLLKRLAERLGRGVAEKTATEAGKVIGTTTTQAAIEQAAPGAFQKVAPKVVTGVQTAGMKAAQEGTVELAKATMPGAASPGMLGAPTLGTVAAIGGEVLKQVSSDDDATTMNVGETAGSVISGAGQGIGAALTAGALLGSSVGPLGTVAGAIGGAAYGLGKGLIQRGKARREEARAEQRKEQDISELASRQRLEALKSREYSGFDMGADIARYGGYYEMGGIKLPGGVAKPIPGSDAIEFKGKSHEQGGIMVDPNTEVEGNETMDKVTMKNGGKSDYFFSQHLKLGGKSFAQRHKDLLKNGGTQGEIDYLAKLQEEKAGRNPEDVKLGAGGYYQLGGMDDDIAATVNIPEVNISPEVPYIAPKAYQPEPMVYDPSKVSREEIVANDESMDNELTDAEKKALRRVGRDVPGLAIGAGAAQLIAPAYAFFKKDRVAEQMGAPGRVKAPALDRVSFNAERAANAAQGRAISRSIDTSGAGPAGIIAKMSTYRQKQQGDIQIAAQEARMNTAIANQEAQMEQQANIRNVANALQVEQMNAQLRENQLAADESRKLGAIDAFTERAAGLAGDVMSYKATERLARATGDMGIYERDRLRNFLKNQINPRTGQPYTNSDIAELFNKRFGEAQATKEDTKEKDNE
jgi:hypothetical protein